MVVLMLGEVLFSENATAFGDVYKYAAFQREDRDAFSEYYITHSEFKHVIDKFGEFNWIGLHCPAINPPFFGGGPFKPTYREQRRYGTLDTLARFMKGVGMLYNTTGFCYVIPACSSFRDPNYYPEWLVDGNLSTCWCEGVKGSGIGQWIMVPLTVLADEPGGRGIQIGFAIVNGCAGCKCNRVKEFRAEIEHGDAGPGILYESSDPHDPEEEPVYYVLDIKADNFSIPLEGSFGWQYVSFEKVAKKYREYVLKNLHREGWPIPDDDWIIKLSIKSVYYGKEKEHTCLSEIRPLFKLNDKEYLTFDCQGRKIIIPASKVKVIEPAPREKDRK